MSRVTEADEVAPTATADVARTEETTQESPPGADAWIDSLTINQAAVECHRRGLVTSGIVPTLRDRLRRYERAAREALDQPLLPVTELPTEEEIRELGRRPVAIGTPPGGERGAIGDSAGRHTGTLCLSGQGTPETRGEARASGKAVKMLQQWGVRFDGERGSGADWFLERIREGRRVAAVSDDELLDSLPYGFGGVALLWYRSGRSSWKGWAEFERAFRARFAAPNFQVELNKEIMRRTQGEEEPVADFLACIRALLDRLVPPWPLSKQLDYVHGNLLPRYQRAVRRREVTDFAAFEAMVMDAETELIAEKRYLPPPAPEQTLLPFAAYRPPARGARTVRHSMAIGWAEGEPGGSGYPLQRRHGWAGEDTAPTAAVMTRRGARETEMWRAAREPSPGDERRGASGTEPERRGPRGPRGPVAGTRATPPGDRPPAPEGRPSSREVRGRDTVSGRVRTGRCWRCGLQGHFARECREPEKQHCTCCKCQGEPSVREEANAGNERRRP